MVKKVLNASVIELLVGRNGPAMLGQGSFPWRDFLKHAYERDYRGHNDGKFFVKIGTINPSNDTRFFVVESIDDDGVYVVTNASSGSNVGLPSLFLPTVPTSLTLGQSMEMYRFGRWGSGTASKITVNKYIARSGTGWILTESGGAAGHIFVKADDSNFGSLFGVNGDASQKDINTSLDCSAYLTSSIDANITSSDSSKVLTLDILNALRDSNNPNAENVFQTMTALTGAIGAAKLALNQTINGVSSRVGINEGHIGDLIPKLNNLLIAYNAFKTSVTGKLDAAKGTHASVAARFTADEQLILDNANSIQDVKDLVNTLEEFQSGFHLFGGRSNNINLKTDTITRDAFGVINGVPSDFTLTDGEEVIVGPTPPALTATVPWKDASNAAMQANYIGSWNATNSSWAQASPVTDKFGGLLFEPRVVNDAYVKINGKTQYDTVIIAFQNGQWVVHGNLADFKKSLTALEGKYTALQDALILAVARIAVNESALRVLGNGVDGDVASEALLVGEVAGVYLVSGESRIVRVSDAQGTITASHAITDGFWYWSRTDKGLYEFKNGTGVALDVVASDEKIRYVTKLLESGVAIPAYATSRRGEAYGNKGANVIYVTPSTGTAWATETLAEKTLVFVISGDNEGIWEVVGTTWTQRQIFDFSKIPDAAIALLQGRMTDVEGVADKNKTALALINTNLDLKENAVDRIETSPSGIGSDIGRFVILTPTLRLRKVYVANPLFPTVKVYKQIDMVEGQRFYNKADSKVWIVKGGVPVLFAQDELTTKQREAIIGSDDPRSGNVFITEDALDAAIDAAKSALTIGNGWTPQWNTYSSTSGDKVYLRINDWIGGVTPKPQIGFIGSGTTLLPTTVGATNFKGEKGDSTGGTGSGAASFFLKFIAKHDVGTFPDLPDGSYIIQNEANGFRVWKYVDGAPEDQRITLDVGECFISMDEDSPPKIAFFRRDSNGVREIFVETGSSSGGTSIESLSILFVDKINVPASALLTTPDGYRFMTDDFGIYKVVNSVAVKQGDLEIGYAILAQDDAHPNSKAFFKRTADSAVPVKVVDIDNVSSFESNLGDTVLKLHSGINIPHVQNIYILTSGFEIAENITDGANSLANLPSGLNIPSQLDVIQISGFAFSHPIASSNVVGDPISLPLDHFKAIPLLAWETILLGFVVIPEGQEGTFGLATGDFSLQVTNYAGGNYLSVRITSQFMGRNASRGYSLGQTFKISDLSSRFGVTGLGASAVSTLITGTNLVTQVIKDLYYSFDATTYIQTGSAERYVPTHLSSGAVVFRDLDPLTIDTGSVRKVDGETHITVPVGTDTSRSWVALARSGEAFDQNHLFRIDRWEDNVLIIKSLIPHFTDNAFLLTLCDVHGIPSPTPYGEYFVYADDLFHEDPTYTHAPDVIINIDPFDTVKGTTHVTTDSALATPDHRHGVWNGDHSKYCIISGYEGIHENEIVGTAILGTAGYNDYLDGYSESDNKGSLTTQTGTLAGINFHSLIVSHFGGVYTLVIVIEKVDSAGEPVDLAGRILRFAYGSTNIVLGDVNVPAKNEALPDAPTNRYEILLTRDIFRLSATVAPRNPITVQELKTTGAQFWVKGEITGNPSTITPVKMVVDGLKKALAENIGGDGVLVAKESFTFGRRTDPRITSVTANPSTVLLQFDTPFHYYNYSEIFILSSRLSTDDNRPIWKLVNLNKDGRPDDEQTVYGTIQATKYGQQKYGYLPNVNIADDPNGATASQILGTHTRFTIGWKTGQTRTLVAEERGPWLVPEPSWGSAKPEVGGQSSTVIVPSSQRTNYRLLPVVILNLVCSNESIQYGTITVHITSFDWHSGVPILTIGGCEVDLSLDSEENVHSVTVRPNLTSTNTNDKAYINGFTIFRLKYPDPTTI